MPSPLLSLPLPHSSGEKSLVNYSALGNVAKVAVKQSRAARNALYRHAQFLNSLSGDVKEYHKENREAQGLPRAFSVRFTDPVVDHDDKQLKKLNGQSLLIGKHGSNDTGIHFNGHDIDPDVTQYSAATNSYSFKTRIPMEDGEKADVGAFINLIGEQPSGILAVGNRSFNIQLDPAKVWFDVKVSANAGAYDSTGKGTLVWDTNKDEWKNATWEDCGLTFGYETKNIGNRLQPRWVAGNTFIDNTGDPPMRFDLEATAMDYAVKYTSTMSGDDGSGPTMVTQIITPPPAAPSSRANKDVKSVFPTLWMVRFSPFGNSFDGVYKDAYNHVYAVSGTMKLGDNASITKILSAPASDVPVQNLNPVAETLLSKPELSMMSTSAPTDGPPLQVFELLNLNPMVQVSTSPTGWRDSVAQLAMKDFHDLIVYFMDDELRKTFVQASTPTLSSAASTVATDDVTSGPGKNKEFY